MLNIITIIIYRQSTVSPGHSDQLDQYLSDKVT